MSTSNAPEEAVIESFSDEAAALTKSALVVELAASLAATDYSLCDRFMDFTDALSAHLGAQAANHCASRPAQERAIRRCEGYVSDEVAADRTSLAAAIVLLHGPDKARELIGELVRTAPAQGASPLGR